MSETIDASDATRTSTAPGTRPARAGAAVAPDGTGRRRVIDLDSVTEAVPAGAPAKSPSIAPPPVRDSSYYLG